MSIKLYYMSGACSLGPHILLEWTRQPYETQRLSLDELKQEAYLRINPAGAVPTLDVDGWILTQNTAIYNYLADRFPETGLGGDGSPESRAEANHWLGLCNSDLHPLFWALFGATDYLGDKAAIEATQAHAKEQIHQRLEPVNRQLAGRDWLTGTRSIADPYLFVIAHWCRAMNIDLTALEHITRFYEGMNADPAVQRVLEAEGLEQGS